MQSEALRALSHGFERGKVVFFEGTKSVAFFNAGFLELEGINSSVFKCEQPQRPQYLQLKQMGWAVDPQLCETGLEFDAAFVALTKHRRYNEILVSRASAMVRQSGFIYVTGEVKSGAASFEKWLGENTSLNGSFSKFHSRVCWFQNDAQTKLTLKNTSAEIELPQGYKTQEGMFSASGADKGSELLASHFDDSIKGAVADFGAGWGYLSDRLLQLSAKVKLLDLYESDWRALQCCMHNVKCAEGTKIALHWMDLETETVPRQYDWIIMNPPFHTGQHRREDLGQTFIAKASASLRRGGKLLMVANTNLPYERVLGEAFFKVEKRDQRDGFKIIKATK